MFARSPREWRTLVSAILLATLASCVTPVLKVVPSSWAAANYDPVGDADVLTIFPTDGKLVMFTLPFRLREVAFAPDGRSLYGINVTNRDGVVRETGGLSKAEFNPMRLTPVPGTTPYGVSSFAVSANQDRVVISGYRMDSNGGSCGLFEILLPAGDVRPVLTSDCLHWSSRERISLSPNGEQAVAMVGSSRVNLHMELVDLVHGTTRPLFSDIWGGVWSPDGKWIAGTRDNDLWLIERTIFQNDGLSAAPPMLGRPGRRIPAISCFGSTACSSAAFFSMSMGQRRWRPWISRAARDPPSGVPNAASSSDRLAG
jgi:hypothetical protein